MVLFYLENVPNKKHELLGSGNGPNQQTELYIQKTAVFSLY